MDAQKVYRVISGCCCYDKHEAHLRTFADRGHAVEYATILNGLHHNDGGFLGRFHDDLAHIEEELEKDGQQLQDYVHELRELGVEPKNGLEGLIDFPCLMDGREVYLCWRLGEAEVLFWHDLDSGFAGRQALTAGAAPK